RQREGRPRQRGDPSRSFLEFWLRKAGARARGLRLREPADEETMKKRTERLLGRARLVGAALGRRSEVEEALPRPRSYRQLEDSVALPRALRAVPARAVQPPPPRSRHRHRQNHHR